MCTSIHIAHPVPCCNYSFFSPFLSFLYTNSRSGPRRTSTNFRNRQVFNSGPLRFFFFFPPTRRGEREEFVIVIILLGAIPKTSRSARYGRGEKTLALYISVFDYTTQRFWAPDARERPGPPIIKFLFIVCHPEINNKTDFTLFFFF